MYTITLRRIIYSVFAIILCGISGTAHCDRLYAGETNRLKIVTSFYPVYIATINIVNDVPGVSVENLSASSTGCLHDYAITTNDMKRIAGADLFIVNGAGMESFLNKVIGQNLHARIITLSEGIPLMPSGNNLEDNPHVWVSISNAIIQAGNLVKALVAYDPGHADRYRANGILYIEKLEALRDAMHEALRPYKGREIITFHEAFPYFAKEFDLEIVGVVEREPGSEPGAKELADTVDMIRKNRKAVLFSEPQYSAGAADLISRETGAKVYVLDPVVTGPDDKDAYIGIMHKNLDVLKRAFREAS